MRDAVVIGIDNYGFNPLSGCVRDARDVEACVTLEQYGFNCSTILDRAASRQRILQVIGEFVYNKREEEKDVLLLYFAGHGTVLGNQGHIVCIDSTEYDPGISLSQLGGLMEAASEIYHHVVLILDTCHSGGAVSWANSRPLSSNDVNREIRAVTESRCILASCRPEETAKEVGGQGVFTSALIRGMLGDAANYAGEVTLLGLHDFVSRTVPESFQTPVFKGDVAGTVVLGSGFDPVLGAPVPEPEMNRILAKAHRFFDEFYEMWRVETADASYRDEQGAHNCAIRLAPILEWFKKTEQTHPDLNRSTEWKTLRSGISEYRATLATVRTGQSIYGGIVKELLGHGGFGHVWRIERPDGTSYALKVFHGNELDDSIKVTRFANGHGNMRKLDHPHIVKVHEILEVPYAFAMDYVPGDNLRRCYFDPDNPVARIRLLIDVAATVRHAHGRGVLHRDIKPENIITVSSGERIDAYLTDFDLAYHETNRTITSNLGVGGVINYAAPEQLYMPSSAAARSEAVDVYSLAQLMFYVIVQKDPAADAHERNVVSFRRALTDLYEPRAAAALLELYQIAAARRPEDRLPNVVDFTSRLASAEVYAAAESGRDNIDPADFARRVGHSFAGLGSYTAEAGSSQFSSLSGQVSIAISASEGRKDDTVDVSCELNVVGTIPVAAFSSGSQARQALNNRLDKSLRRFPDTRRHPGNKGVFQTFVDCSSVPSTIEGVKRLIDVLTAAVSAIENWG